MDTEFERDMMDFILNYICKKDSPSLYYAPNNITATYYAMELFKEKIKKHPLIFKIFSRFKISTIENI